MAVSCYFCNESDVTDTHHIVPKRFGGSDQDENLVEVCPTCHRKLENMYDKRFYQQLGVVEFDVEDEENYGKFHCNRCDRRFFKRIKNVVKCPYCGTRQDLELESEVESEFLFGSKLGIENRTEFEDRRWFELFYIGENTNDNIAANRSLIKSRDAAFSKAFDQYCLNYDNVVVAEFTVLAKEDQNFIDVAYDVSDYLAEFEIMRHKERIDS